MLDVEFGQATNAGRIRTNNEDATGWLVPRSRLESRARGWLFALADGVGGADLGEVASAKAIEVICRGFQEAPENTSLLSLLPRLIQHANAAVHDEGLARERRGRTMATTVVACALRHAQAVVAHVGDSRCYHVRDGVATAVTQDHTWANQQRGLGLISAADIATSENRHVLTKSLGQELFVSADATTVALHPGDRLILCCDGVYGGLSDSEIGRIASQDKRPQALATELVETSVERDGSDNTTAIVMAIRSTEPMAMYRGRLYPLPGR